jgi:arsenate reductase
VLKKRVLFLCIGNACRSQMAEGFARAYGSDVIEPCSAGLGPAPSMPPLTLQTMQEKNIDLSAAFPKGLDGVQRDALDLIVNLSGTPMPRNLTTPVENWEVRDPMGRSEETFREVRDEIEARVMDLILNTRAEMSGKPLPRKQGRDSERPPRPSRFDILKGLFRQ